MSSDEEGAPDVDDQDEDVDEGEGNAAEDAQASPTRHNLRKPSTTVGSQRPLSPPTLVYASVHNRIVNKRVVVGCWYSGLRRWQ